MSYIHSRLNTNCQKKHNEGNVSFSWRPEAERTRAEDAFKSIYSFSYPSSRLALPFLYQQPL